MLLTEPRHFKRELSGPARIESGFLRRFEEL